VNTPSNNSTNDTALERAPAHINASELSPPERKHHSTSPSTLQSREACPGYEPEQGETSEASARGTTLHDATLATSVLSDFDIPDDERGVVQKCRDFVTFLQDALSKPLAEGESRTAENSATLLQEVYLPVDDQDTTAGFIDNGIVSWDMKTAIILDWKMGKNPVEESKNNLQGIAYLLGLYHAYPTLVEVRVIFCMPFQGVEGTLDEHTFLKSEFEMLLTRIKTVVASTKIARALFDRVDGYLAEGAPVPDEVFNRLKGILTGRACLFCARKGYCPVTIETCIEVGKKYDPLVIPEIVNPSLPLPGKESGQMLKLMQVLESVAKAYRASITNRAVTEEDFMPTGYMLSMVTRRKIVDKQKFYEVIASHLTPAEIIEVTDYTFGPVETLVKNKAALGMKKAAVEELTNELALHGATEEGAPVPVLKQTRGSKDSST